MIDADGFRANVGIILTNTQGQVLWAKRVGHNSWQFPQGGIDHRLVALSFTKAVRSSWAKASVYWAKTKVVFAPVR